ncbi:MAG: hypothetical protein ABH832_03975 [bacterium]
MSIIIFQRILLEAIADLLYFPIWWYTGGLFHAIKWCIEFFKLGNSRLGPFLWLRYIFTPMFGQWDWQGRIISFFMRLANVIIRLVLLAMWMIFCSFLFLLWVMIPVLLIYWIIMASL